MYNEKYFQVHYSEQKLSETLLQNYFTCFLRAFLLNIFFVRF